MANFPALEWFQHARERTNADPAFRKLGTADARFGVRQGDTIVEVQLDAFEIGTIAARSEDEVRELDFCLEMSAEQWGAYLDGLRGTGTRRSISDVDLLTPGGVVRAVNARGAIVMPRYLLSIDRFFANGAQAN